jgi:hypothetical protein
MGLTDDLEGRAREYLQHNGMMPGEQLGFGIHGIVFTADRQPTNEAASVRSAVKIFRREVDYRRERDVYLRLQEEGVTTICDCRVPQLIAYDDTLCVIEMTVVSRPFVLDFAGAYLDIPPEFSEEVMADWAAEKQEQFGARWHDAQQVLAALECHGIYMIDVNPGNIAFAD